MEASNPPTHSGQNNTIAVGGYDAYFGTYEVNETTGKVSHTLIGSITPANIGITVSGVDMRATENNLTIQLETTNAGRRTHNPNIDLEAYQLI